MSWIMRKLMGPSHSRQASPLASGAVGDVRPLSTGVSSEQPKPPGSSSAGVSIASAAITDTEATVASKAVQNESATDVNKGLISSNCPDVVDVRTARDRFSTGMGGSESFDDEVDSSLQDSPVPSSFVSAPSLVGPSFSSSHLSLVSSVEDDDIDRRRSNNCLNRKISLSSSSSLPGHMSDWPRVHDNDRSWRPAATDTSSLSATSLPPTVCSSDSAAVDRSAVTEHPPAAVSSEASKTKLTYRKKEKPARQRRVTTEVRMSDQNGVLRNIGPIDPNLPASEGSGSRARALLRHAGSLKVRSSHRTEEDGMNGSFKSKHLSLKSRVVPLPIKNSVVEESRRNLEIHAIIDELEENTDFEVVQRPNGRVRSADRLDIITDHLSDRELGEGLNFHGRVTAVIRPIFSSSRRSRDTLNDLLSLDVSSFRTSRQNLCCYHGGVRISSVSNAKDRYTHIRYMFLFNNHLLIAKPRNSAGTQFTLKNKVRLVDIWLSDSSTNRGDVNADSTAETELKKSFVIGWPIVNYVATFQTTDETSSWFKRLQKMCNDRRADQPAKEVLKIVRKDSELTVTKSLSVSLGESADRILKRCMSEFHFSESDAKDYHLVVQLSKYPQAVPLIGFELPLSIYLFECGRYSEATTETSTPRSVQSQPAIFNLVRRDNKPVMRRPKSPRVTLFRKSQNPQLPSGEGTKLRAATGKLFGRSVEDLCGHGVIPKPIMDLLQQLYEQGPFAEGVFRKPSNVKQSRNLRERLDAGDDIGELSIYSAAGTLKEFLRGLPDCLLICAWYPIWIQIMQENSSNRIDQIKVQVLKLPAGNSLLLRHLLCVLCRIARHSDENKMTSSNLSTCIAPSLLWDVNPVSAQSVGMAMADQASVLQLVDVLISRAADIWTNPAECIELMRSESSLRSKPALSSLSVQTVSSTSFSDSDDNAINGPQAILDFEGDIPREAMIDQLSPASRDSGLVLGSQYRYSNEELAITSGTNSPDYDPVLDIVDRNVTDHSTESDSMYLIVPGRMTSDSKNTRKLPDILEGQPISRADSGMATSLSSSSTNGVTSKMTGTARERIHHSRIQKTSSDDSAVGRGSIEERSSVFEASEDEVDCYRSPNENTNENSKDAVISTINVDDPVNNPRFENDTSMTAKHGSDRAVNVTRHTETPLSPVAISPSATLEPPNIGDGRSQPTSSVDLLFHNLNLRHQEKYGEIVDQEKLGQEDVTQLTAGEAIPTAAHALESHGVQPRRSESFGPIKPHQLTDQQSTQAAASPTTRRGQLLAMHNMQRSLQPAVAYPEIWPTSSVLSKRTVSEHDEDTIGQSQHSKERGLEVVTPSANRTTVGWTASTAEAKSVGRGTHQTVEANGSSVISSKPSRQHNQPTSEQDCGSSRADVLAPNRAPSVPSVEQRNIRRPSLPDSLASQQQQPRLPNKMGSSKSDLLTKQSNLNGIIDELPRSSASVSDVQHNPLRSSAQAHHNNGAPVTYANSYNNQIGAVRMPASAQPVRPAKGTANLPSDALQTPANSSISLSKLRGNIQQQSVEQKLSNQPQGRAASAQVTVVTVTDECTIIEQRKNIPTGAVNSKDASSGQLLQQPQPSTHLRHGGSSVRVSATHQIMQAPRPLHQQQQQLRSDVNGRTHFDRSMGNNSQIVVDGRSLTNVNGQISSANSTDNNSAPANVAKLRSKYEVTPSSSVDDDDYYRHLQQQQQQQQQSGIPSSGSRGQSAVRYNKPDEWPYYSSVPVDMR